MANKRYKEINFEDESGMLRSLLTSVAIIPNKKNKRTGFVRLVISMSIFKIVVLKSNKTMGR